MCEEGPSRAAGASRIRDGSNAGLESSRNCHPRLRKAAQRRGESNTGTLIVKRFLGRGASSLSCQRRSRGAAVRRAETEPSKGDAAWVRGASGDLEGTEGIRIAGAAEQADEAIPAGAMLSRSPGRAAVDRAGDGPAPLAETMRDRRMGAPAAPPLARPSPPGAGTARPVQSPCCFRHTLWFSTCFDRHDPAHSARFLPEGFPEPAAVFGSRGPLARLLLLTGGRTEREG
jgi:hypothetical protein